MRSTAAKQLAQAATKSVSGDVEDEDDVKSRDMHAMNYGMARGYATLYATLLQATKNSVPPDSHHPSGPRSHSAHAKSFIGFCTVSDIQLG